MTLADVYDIVRNICLYDKDRIFVTSDIQPLTLSYRIELGSVMFSDNLSIWIVLVPGLLDVFPAAPVCLSLELYVIFHRL